MRYLLFSFILVVSSIPAIGSSAFAETRLCHIAFEKKQYGTAFAACREVAAQDPLAQYVLGVLYLEGKGVSANPKQAIRWFLRAAEHGVTEASRSLGEVFSVGKIGSKNYKEAVFWYKRAAESGDPESQANLGLMIANGRGAAKDLVQGAMWLELASDKGHEGATQSLAHLKKNMSPADVEKAKAMVQKWRADRLKKIK